MTAIQNTKKAKERRRLEAEARQEVRNKRTPAEQLSELERRDRPTLAGSAKERARLIPLTSKDDWVLVGEA